MDMDWAQFLGRPQVVVDAGVAALAVGGRSVLITGAGGSIGSLLAEAALAGHPLKLMMLDVSEGALYRSYRRLSATAQRGIEIIPITGSVADRKFLDYLFRKHHPELIFHAAAYKHVPLMEQNPFSAVANNSIGTYRLVQAALNIGVQRLVAVSTDKAVNPASIMGASKRIAELAVLSHSCEETRMNAVRLGNVLGSSGSVAPIFAEQAQQGLALTVTHAEAERYFLTPAEAGLAILRAAASPVWGRVFIPDCGRGFRIVDLARYIAGRCGVEGELAIEFTGLRPGDKLREALWAGDETVAAVLADGMRVIKSPTPSAGEVSLSMQRLEDAIGRFDNAALMAAVIDLAPAYKIATATKFASASEGVE